jgi:type VI secretion system protein ImpC
MTSEKIHDRYLWANPSFACAYLLAETFRRDGWDFMPGSIQDIDKLPLHVSAEQDESRIKPCAEVVLTEVAVEAILERGLMPLLSYKNRDYVRLARFQSIADPLTGLNGRWTAG